MRQKYYFLCLVFIQLFLCGCEMHSWGPKNISTELSQTQSVPLMLGQSIYISAITPLPEETSDSTEFIVAQFARYVSGLSRDITTGTIVSTREEGIAASRAVGAKYLILLQIEKWKKHSLLDLGHEAALVVTVIDSETGQILNRSKIESDCYVMLVGLEQSPRECIRPQIVAWMEKTFNTTVHSKPHTDRKTFDMMQ